MRFTLYESLKFIYTRNVLEMGSVAVMLSASRLTGTHLRPVEASRSEKETES